MRTVCIILAFIALTACGLAQQTITDYGYLPCDHSGGQVVINPPGQNPPAGYSEIEAERMWEFKENGHTYLIVYVTCHCPHKVFSYVPPHDDIQTGYWSLIYTYPCNNDAYEVVDMTGGHLKVRVYEWGTENTHFYIEVPDPSLGSVSYARYSVAISN